MKMRPSMRSSLSPITSRGKGKKSRYAYNRIKHPERSEAVLIGFGWRGRGAAGFRFGAANGGWGAAASASGRARAVAAGFVLAR